MEWNAFFYNINKNEIITLNIFNHLRFCEDVENNLKKFKNKEEFAEILMRDLAYYFRYKSEYEIIIGPWVGGDLEKDSIRVDIYTQVMSNWEIFLDYVWSFK